MSSHGLHPKRLNAILWIGFVAGTLDITTALIVYKMHPVTMFQFISSAAFGREVAFSGGIWTVFSGIIFHYVIAYAWTLLFFFFYPRLKLSSQSQAVAVGLLYGIVIWMVMNLVVLRFTYIPHAPFDFLRALKGAIILMIMVGLPIALLTHQYYSRKKSG